MDSMSTKPYKYLYESYSHGRKKRSNEGGAEWFRIALDGGRSYIGHDWKDAVDRVEGDGLYICANDG
jgi:hypothetical protein